MMDMPMVHYVVLSGFLCEIFHLKKEGNKGGGREVRERRKETGQASMLHIVKKTKNGKKYRNEKNEATISRL